MSDTLQRVYSAFQQRPLGAGQDELYVNLDEVRGSSGTATRMEQKIRRADGPTCQVLTGHLGSGKSTELWRLRQALEVPDAAGERFFVVMFQADEHIDRNDVDFPEVLIAIIRQVAEQLQTRLGITLAPGYFRDRWQRLKDLLGAFIEFDEVNLTLGMAELSAKLRHSPDARQGVRKLLDPDTDNWLRAANDVLGKAIQQVQQKGYRNLVVVVDDLDKIISRPHETTGRSTTEHLFLHRSPQMTAFACHVVYTMPLELAYSHHERTLKRIYGGHVPVVPMTKIATTPPKPRPYAKGIAKFREIIATRLRAAGARESDLFSNSRVRDDLIKLSGGHPTELMRLVCEALITDGLPISSAGLRRCRIEATRSYRRTLRADHWPLIEQVRNTGQIVRTMDNDDAFRELLEGGAILLYVNDGEWYGLNPVVAELEPPSSGVPRSGGAAPATNAETKP